MLPEALQPRGYSERDHGRQQDVRRKHDRHVECGGCRTQRCGGNGKRYIEHGQCRGAFDSKNVGTGKTVTVSGLTLGRTDSGNYSLTQPTTTANITAKGLTVSGITAGNKTYNGNTTATLNVAGAVLNGGRGDGKCHREHGRCWGAFDNKNVGTGKTVTVSGLTLGGTDFGNYSLTQPTTTANITRRSLIVTVTGVDKVYDGTVTATIGLFDDRIVGDILTITYNTAAFLDPNVGNGKTVNVSGISISGGTDAGNYLLATHRQTQRPTLHRADQTITITTHAPSSAVNGSNFTVGWNGNIRFVDHLQQRHAWEFVPIAAPRLP